MKLLLLVLSAVSILSSYCQFPSICNTDNNLNRKVCCPHDCYENKGRGKCTSVVDEVGAQFESADSTITDILCEAPRVHGTIDARYKWPTAVFNQVCVCHSPYGGVDCSDCDYGFIKNGEKCMANSVTRKSFVNLSDNEKRDFIQATMKLKSEMGQWSVIVEEPRTSTGTVTLQDVSTYNFLVHIHSYVSRDRECTEGVDFAHKGPVFPVWHRRYLLIVEKEYQRIMENPSFGFPYWQWEENDKTPFKKEYFGPTNSYGGHKSVTGTFGDSQIWSTICDLPVFGDNECAANWNPCNPNEHLGNLRTLQRGTLPNDCNNKIIDPQPYLPNRVEVMIAIAAPNYDTSMRNSRDSFRRRLEGFNTIRSAVRCTGPEEDREDCNSKQYMHNNVHNWIGGHMAVISAAVNDPIFSLHHCNIDRILESWIKNKKKPPYYPMTGGHPGHNWNDYMVPFFPLVKVSQQYNMADKFGYKYDHLVDANIKENQIVPCSLYASTDNNNKRQLTCDANGTCIKCDSQYACPQPSSTRSTSTSAMLLLPLSLLLLLLQR